jgi:hypothetical protein
VTLPAKSLILRLKAYEKSKFSEFEGENDDEYRYKAKNVFIDLKLNCIDFPEALGPGDYTFAFDLILPTTGCPASIEFNDSNDRHRPKARVQYTMKAIIETTDNRVLKYKQLLIIHGKPVSFVQDKYDEHNVNISECLCVIPVDRGWCKLQVRFQKNVFFANEKAYCEVLVDNSKCDQKIEEIEF